MIISEKQYNQLPNELKEHFDMIITKNDHVTVKPQSLISYLIKLVTPVNGIVLDPFMGSGTTALCCVKLGNYNYVGFEMDSHYCEIAEKRIKSEIENKK